MANYTVSKDPNGGWNAKRDNASRVSYHGNTQREVEVKAKDFSTNSGGGEVRIKDINNKFRDSDTVRPGNDPNPPKDKIH